MTTDVRLCTTFLECRGKAGSIMRLRSKWVGELRHHKVQMLKREGELAHAADVLEHFVVVYATCVRSEPSLKWHLNRGFISNEQYAQRMDLIRQARAAALTYTETATELAELFVFHYNRVERLMRILNLEGFSTQRAKELEQQGSVSIREFVQNILSRR